ncbi:hypothetical protein K461DRAFT_308399 [Myriangium duriaei CBS 260.36]|uniref:Uncharacterized protein n=1 Tax=Myriangium duriaei CBS 260.36 TaxID=1168546 RepID=A0A9P4IXX5_9PEZI|nr:hypothetical protein K461DRAFT_308399 [Myriangium duriaei CBS 260.36]
MVSFKQCQANFSEGLANPDATIREWYQGLVFNGKPYRITKNESSQITYPGCRTLCGTGSDYYPFSTISSTITTWILPIIGVLLQGPFESNNSKATFLAICRWVGSPITSLSYVLWNIRVIGKCAMMGKSWHAHLQIPSALTFYKEWEEARLVRRNFYEIRDPFYILQAMNQFGLRLLKRRNQPESEYSATAAEGLLRIALFSQDLELQTHCTCSRHSRTLLEARSKLAQKLRNRRKRGIIPVFISTFWFLFALALSIQTAFAELGDNATAHDLALGLMLGWLPVLILGSIADRNPTDPEGSRDDLNKFVASVCVSLLNDKIYNDYVEFIKRRYIFTNEMQQDDKISTELEKIREFCRALVRSEGYDTLPFQSVNYNAPRTPSIAGSTRSRGDTGVSPIAPPTADLDDLTSPSRLNRCQNDKEPLKVNFFGGFAGQGRVRWHYGVAHPILSEIEDAYIAADRKNNGRQRPGKRNWLEDHDQARVNLVLGRLDQRQGLIWWDLRELWQISVSAFIVCGTCLGALILSYNTPTVGLGCRSGGYLIFMVISIFLLVVELLSWLIDWGRIYTSLFGSTTATAPTSRFCSSESRTTANVAAMPGNGHRPSQPSLSLPNQEGYEMTEQSSRSDSLQPKNSVALDTNQRFSAPETIQIIEEPVAAFSPHHVRSQSSLSSVAPLLPHASPASPASPSSPVPSTPQPPSPTVPIEEDNPFENFDPNDKRRFINRALTCGEVINTTWLIYIVFGQTSGGFRSCECMASAWQLGSKGYIDFNQVTVTNTPSLPYYWGFGTALGTVAMFIGLLYVVMEWLLQSHLNTLDNVSAENGLRRVRRWRKYTIFIRRTRNAVMEWIAISVTGLARLLGIRTSPRRREMVWTADESKYPGRAPTMPQGETSSGARTSQRGIIGVNNEFVVERLRKLSIPRVRRSR